MAILTRRTPMVMSAAILSSARRMTHKLGVLPNRSRSPGFLLASRSAAEGRRDCATNCAMEGTRAGLNASAIPEDQLIRPMALAPSVITSRWAAEYRLGCVGRLARKD